jgi:hypothetical protein
MGVQQFFSRPSMERVARGLEEKFPKLRDDVTNSLLLFDEIGRSKGFNQISKVLVRSTFVRL